MNLSTQQHQVIAAAAEVHATAETALQDPGHTSDQSSTVSRSELAEHEETDHHPDGNGIIITNPTRGNPTKQPIIKLNSEVLMPLSSVGTGRFTFESIGSSSSVEVSPIPSPTQNANYIDTTMPQLPHCSLDTVGKRNSLSQRPRMPTPVDHSKELHLEVSLSCDNTGLTPVTALNEIVDLGMLRVVLDAQSQKTSCRLDDHYVTACDWAEDSAGYVNDGLGPPGT